MPLEEKDEEQDKIQLSERKKYEKSIKDTLQDIVSSYKYDLFISICFY